MRKDERMTEKKKRGRPNQGFSEGMFIKFKPAQKAAIDGYVERLNRQREEKGLPPIAVSTWAREVILAHIGRLDLGISKQAEKLARSAGMI